MLVFADTSPLNYLILIDAVEVLSRLYEQVILPRAVWEELQHPNAPRSVAEWAWALPEWIEVRDSPTLSDADDVLGRGEKETIALAELYRSESRVLLLLDEQAARKEAVARGIAVTGTLGVLKAAAAKGWINLARALDRLRETNFRVSSVLLQEILAERVDIAAE